VASRDSSAADVSDAPSRASGSEGGSGTTGSDADARERDAGDGQRS
jgi:hypothetical protein